MCRNLTHAPQQTTDTGRNDLLDHRVGAGQQRWRHINPERLGSLHIDDQLENGGLLDRQVGRPGPFQDFVMQPTIQ
jgi:hypothetical protein